MSVRNISERDLLVVARRWAQRSPRTSVERFLDFLPGAHKITSDEAWRRPYRLLKQIAGRARQDGYTSHSVGLEAAALGSLLLQRPRLVHFLYADHDYHYLGRFARRLGCRIAGTFWFSIEEFERRMPDKSHLAGLDLVVTSGQEQQRYLSRFVPEEKLAYLPLGVDTEFFRPPAAPRERWQKRRILQVGVNRRDFETLRQMFAELRREDPELELHMVGCGNARPAFSAEAGVVFQPFLDDDELLCLYQQSAILVLPLYEGGSSNALNEALATGLPIVATRQPNLADYTSPDCVTLCRPSDPPEMAAACRRLLSDHDTWQKASAAARARGERYGWPTVRHQLADIYLRHLGLRLDSDRP